MSVATDRGTRKALRTVLQLAAAGGLTALVSALADGLAPAQAGLLVAAWGVVVTFLQNTLETAGMIPVVLPTQPIPKENQ